MAALWHWMGARGRGEMGQSGVKWDGMEEGGKTGWGRTGWTEMGHNGMGWDRVGWDKMGLNGTGWGGTGQNKSNRMGQDIVGWDGTRWSHGQGLGRTRQDGHSGHLASLEHSGDRVLGAGSGPHPGRSCPPAPVPLCPPRGDTVTVPMDSWQGPVPVSPQALHQQGRPLHLPLHPELPRHQGQASAVPGLPPPEVPRCGHAEGQ